MNPMDPKPFPQKTSQKSKDYRNEKWEEVKNGLYKSSMGRFATTEGVGGDYPMAEAKLITEEEYKKLYDKLKVRYRY